MKNKWTFGHCLRRSLLNLRTATGKRDQTLLCFMYASGARAQEVCDLTVADVTFFSDRATVKLLGKGRKVRTINIPADAAAILKRYLEYRKIEKKYERHIFSSQTHEKMSVSCIEEIFFKYIEKEKRNIRNISEKIAIHRIL